VRADGGPQSEQSIHCLRADTDDLGDQVVVAESERDCTFPRHPQRLLVLGPRLGRPPHCFVPLPPRFADAFALLEKPVLEVKIEIERCRRINRPTLTHVGKPAAKIELDLGQPFLVATQLLRFRFEQLAAASQALN